MDKTSIEVFCIILIAVLFAEATRADVCEYEASGTRLSYPGRNCSIFVICELQRITRIGTCPRGLHFNGLLGECDLPSRANCEQTPNVDCEFCDCSICCGEWSTPPTRTTTTRKIPTKTSTTPAITTTNYKPTQPSPPPPTCPPVTVSSATDGPSTVTSTSWTYPTKPPTTKLSTETPPFITPPTSPPITATPPTAGPSTVTSATRTPSTKTPPTEPSTRSPPTIPTSTEIPRTPSTENPGRCLDDPRCLGRDGAILHIDGYCDKFIVCDGDCPMEQQCAGGLYFNSAIGECDYPSSVNCTWDRQPLEPSTGPSGTSCLVGGKCVGQRDGTTLPSDYSCNQYIVCQCQCEIEMTCPDHLEFNRVLKTCDWPAKAECMIT